MNVFETDFSLFVRFFWGAHLFAECNQESDGLSELHVPEK